MQIFQLSVTFIVSFLLITNLSYVRILLLLSLTVILLKMYVEAYKMSVKLNVKSKVIFFLFIRFFLMFIMAVCVLLFLIKLRWLKNRSIYDKVSTYQPPKNPWTKIEPPTPTNPTPILIENLNLKLIKIKLFAANILIKGMFQALN